MNEGGVQYLLDSDENILDFVILETIIVVASGGVTHHGNQL